MSESSVAIVGSGIVGTTLAYLFARRGYDVDIFEKGPEFPYPHGVQFQQRILYGYDNPAYTLPPDLQNLVVTGDYRGALDRDRAMVVGGTATHWGGVTLRARPEDFSTRSRYGYGADWPLGYETLEPDYCGAEAFLGVSGTDADNPFAPPRSKPHPLPPFELSYDDTRLALKLGVRGITLHTTPQARTRRAYDARPQCMNFGACEVCPIGARYSPGHHLARALKIPGCRLHPRTSVRRIVVDGTGGASSLVYQENGSATQQEHHAKVFVIAGGAIESARLLLLSSRDRHPDGVPLSSHVGRHLMLHHAWMGRLRYTEALMPGNVGPVTAQCQQFLAPQTRGKHGGVQIFFSSDFSSNIDWTPMGDVEGKTPPEVVELFRQMRHLRWIVLQGESAPSARKFVELSTTPDRFGDPFAHVHYEASDFDRETYAFSRRLFEKFANATAARDAELDPVEQYDSAAHHIGTCRMGRDARDSVVDEFGRIHGLRNLFVIGGANLPGIGAVQPTLTMVALALRSARYIAEQIR